ncbi:vWA domain-containing protein [Roseateles noduli]|uniref:vWA domain-containing protein n=1 Tax=Roseateles noduli TaxID=2052484 RepID=UPI003D662CBC
MSFPSRSAVAQSALVAVSFATLAACTTSPAPDQRASDQRAQESARAADAKAAPTEQPPPRPSPGPLMPIIAAAPAAPAPIAEQRQRAAVSVAAYAPQWTPPPPASTAKYTAFSDNPWQRAAELPVSTFGASVDTGSYANVRRFINRGQMPPQDAVRVEELVNYFGFDAPGPEAGERDPFKVRAQVLASPWNADRGLIRIAIKGKDIAKASLPPANLVFLVDVSGSMGPEDRLPLVKSALKLLTAQLRPVDRVSVVIYANGTRIALAPTPGDRKASINSAIDQLQAGGATYGEGGLKLAYAQARESFIPEGINRVLLATDGDLNVGETNPETLKKMIEGERDSGVTLTALGVGQSNFNEALMKKLADTGNGSYHYLDSLQEAHKVLVNEMTSTLATIAQDLKLQVEFNPATVQEYRLIGYELHALKREDFNNDKVDAGDIGAGHQVTALYEFVPAGAKGNVDPLRYGNEGKAAAKEPPRVGKNGELAWIKLRYKAPGQSTSQLVELPVAKPATIPALAAQDADTRFAVAVAAWGQWLRGSSLIGNYGPEQFVPLARGARGEDRYGHRAEFARLAELSASLKR